jgi:hypothetical protein
MRYLGLAFGMALVLGLVIFGAVYSVVGDAHLAEGLAALPLVGSPHMAEMLERHDARQSLAPDRPTAIHSIHGFAIPWPQMMLYAVIGLVALVHISSGIAGLVWGAVSGGKLLTDMPEQIASASIMLVLPTEVIGAYLIGRWIATRIYVHGMMVVLASCAIAAVLARAIDFAVIAPDMAQKLYDAPISAQLFIQLALSNFIIFAISASLGFWRGTKLRLTKYMQYLLGVLPSESRDTIVNLAYEEAERIGRNTTPPPKAMPHALP